MDNPVLVIEHNMDNQSADFIVDLGLRVASDAIAKGTPEQVSKTLRSYTGKFLREELK